MTEKNILKSDSLYEAEFPTLTEGTSHKSCNNVNVSCKAENLSYSARLRKSSINHEESNTEIGMRLMKLKDSASSQSFFTKSEQSGRKNVKHAKRPPEKQFNEDKSPLLKSNSCDNEGFKCPTMKQKIKNSSEDGWTVVGKRSGSEQLNFPKRFDQDKCKPASSSANLESPNPAKSIRTLYSNVQCKHQIISSKVKPNQSLLKNVTKVNQAIPYPITRWQDRSSKKSNCTLGVKQNLNENQINRNLSCAKANVNFNAIDTYLPNNKPNSTKSYDKQKCGFNITSTKKPATCKEHIKCPSATNNNVNKIQNVSSGKLDHKEIPIKSNVNEGRKSQVSKRENSPDKVNILDLNLHSSNRRRRKSKVKRQAALKSDKLKIITPEIHSKILRLNREKVAENQIPIKIDINDSNEYPELSQSINLKLKSETHSKNEKMDENSTNNKENAVVSILCDQKPQSEEESYVTGKQIDVKVVEQEKQAVHSNNPITISLFDFMVKKPKRKEHGKDQEPSTTKSTTKNLNIKKITNICAVNPLDSSKPAVKRGKERETPKPKKPSQLKKIILLDRMHKKEKIMKSKSAEKDETANEQEYGFELGSLNNNYDEALNNFSQPDLLDGNKNCEIMLAVHNLNVEVSSESENVLSCNSTVLPNKTNINELDGVYCEHELNSNETSSEEMSNKCVEQKLKDDTLVENILCTSNQICELNLESGYKDQFINCDNAAENLFKNVSSNNIKNIEVSTGDKLVSLIKTSINKHMDNNFDENCNSSVDLNVEISVSDLTVSTKKNNVKFGEIDLFAQNQTFREVLNSCKKSENLTPGKYSDQDLLRAASFAIHSRKFREYCTHFLCKELEESVISLLSDLARFQDRMHQKDPVKARMKRRLLYGIREIKRHIKLKKMKCIIIASDIEDSGTEGGLNDMVNELKLLAKDNQFPCIFSLLRRKLGQVCHKPTPVSAVGILNYEGSEVNFKKMLELQSLCKEDYLKVIKLLSGKLTDEEVSLLFETKCEDLANLHNVAGNILRKYFPKTKKGENSQSLTEIEGITPPTNNHISILDVAVSSCLNAKMDVKEDQNDLMAHTDENQVYDILFKYKVINY